MVYPMWAYQDIMSEHYEDPRHRTHLQDCGYDYEDGYWFRRFEYKIVVARKDHPDFNIKKGERHRFIKIKVIRDEDGVQSWEVGRFKLAS